MNTDDYKNKAQYKQQLRDNYKKIMNKSNTVDDSLIESIEASEAAVKIVDNTTQSEAICSGVAEFANSETVERNVPLAAPSKKLKAGNPTDGMHISMSKKMVDRFTGTDKEFWLQFYGYRQWTGLEAIPPQM